MNKKQEGIKAKAACAASPGTAVSGIGIAGPTLAFAANLRAGTARKK